MKRTLTVIVSLICAASATYLAAQSMQEFLQKNEDYRQAQDHQNKAKADFDRGDYDSGYANSQKAKEFAKKAQESTLIMFVKYRTNSWKNRAEEQIRYATQKGAATNSIGKTQFTMATNYYREGNDMSASGESLAGWPSISNTYEQAIGQYSNAAGKAIEANDAIRAWERQMALKAAFPGLIMKAKANRAALIRDRLIKTGDEDDKSILAFITDAEAAFKAKDYETADSKARAAVDLTDTIRKRDEAEKIFSLASAALDGAKQSKLGTEKPQEIQEASGHIDNAKTALDKENYDDCIKFSKDALAVLDRIGGGAILPKYYKVRLIPKRRDCLWRIAEYDFVYKNGAYWHVLYNANRDSLKYPDNPDLIFPGQVFMLPSLKGEKREGTYDPNKRYAPYNQSLYPGPVRANVTPVPPHVEKKTEKKPEVKVPKVEKKPETKAADPKAGDALPAKETKPKEPTRMPGARY